MLHGLTEDNAGGFTVERQAETFAFDRAVAVDGFSEDVDNATEEAFADGNRSDFACAADGHTFGYVVDFIEEDDTHIAFFEVHSHAGSAVAELDEFVSLDVFEPVDVSHAVANVEDSAHFLERSLGIEPLELLFQNVGYLTWVNHFLFFTYEF